MKKNLTVLTAILITLFSIQAKAQDDDLDNQAKGYFGVLGGFSMPLGAYKSTNYNNNNAGFAQTGLMAGLDAAFYLHKNFGIGITFTYQDQGELTTNDDQNLANGYNNSFGKEQTTVTSVGRYQSVNLLAGPQYSFVRKKFTLDLRADAGVIKNFATPSLIVVFDYASNGETFNQFSSQSLAVAYGGSASLRYAFSDAWDVGFRINYVNTNDLKIENAGNPNTGGRFQTQLPVSVLQSTLSIMVKF